MRASPDILVTEEMPSSAVVTGGVSRSATELSVKILLLLSDILSNSGDSDVLSHTKIK